MKVPDVLLSGDSKKIESWKSEQAIKNTKSRRPDLL
jgi:tRNA (guanine37-N1)-methyltransferase